MVQSVVSSSVELSSFNILPGHLVQTNLSKSHYRPYFFENPEYGLSRIIFKTWKFSKEDVEKILLSGSYSFAFLRDGELRTIEAYDGCNSLVHFDDFCARLNLDIKSSNIFKTGKYLSRIFRPVRYGKFISDLQVHVNENPAYRGSVTDGISLVSLNLARSLGWSNVKPNMSAQFTLCDSSGMVKGNCIISDIITHDVVIYGLDNIKTEIRLTKDSYVALEPLKLSTNVRLDIQSMLNLWTLFTPEQYIDWAKNGIQTFINDLISGRLENWLDDFDEVETNDLIATEWTLQKAIYYKIDYRQFPGLFRQGWTMFRQQMKNIALGQKGNASFRIPISFSYRGYFRVDLRNHDGSGNFSPSVAKGSICLDKLGNIWINPADIEEFLKVKGGADLDDNAVVLPLSDQRAVVWRNPNQFQEFGIHPITYEGISPDCYATITDKLKPKEVSIKNENIVALPINQMSDNPFILRLLDSFHTSEMKLPYSRESLLRAFNVLLNNRASIGVVANAEMVRSSLLITNPDLFHQVTDLFDWNLENVIDSSVKEGSDASSDMEKVYGFYDYLADSEIQLPLSLKDRIPDKFRRTLTFTKEHPVDYLHEALNYLITSADKLVMGDGIGVTRKPGLIDNLKIPFLKIGQAAKDNPLLELANDMLRRYNRSIAILLESTSKLTDIEGELKRKDGIEDIQLNLLQKLVEFTPEDRQIIANAWAYKIYSSGKAVHDSILWIGDKEGLSGTANDMITMLCNLGIASTIKVSEIDPSHCIRYEAEREVNPSMQSIRVWSENEVLADKYRDVKAVTIKNHSCYIGEAVFHLGSECTIKDSEYPVQSIVPAISKKNRNMILKNSMTIFIC